MEGAERHARERGLRLTAAHWLVLCRAREECLSGASVPDLVTLAQRTCLAPGEIERLFPGDTCRLIARLAGLDEPPCGKAS